MIGCLLGTAVGDALGLPCEGLSKRRQAKLFPVLDCYFFVGKKGMVSDDTEHTCFVAQALIASSGEVEKFSHHLSWSLRFWLLSLPGGIGFATLRAILKLWIGFPVARSGVFSAGNGPAMRSAIIGVCYGDNPPQLREIVRASTRLTHTDPKAEYGALAIAWAAYLASQNENVCPENFRNGLADLLPEANAAEFLALMTRAVEAVLQGISTAEFAIQLGLEKGITGYIYHTVPGAIHAWLLHPNNFLAGITTIIRCGGDTDTTAAIVGAIIGARVGKAGIPKQFLQNLSEWPRSIQWIEKLGQQLSEVIEDKKAKTPLSLNYFAVAMRNLFFISVVIAHVLRRLLPPY